MSVTKIQLRRDSGANWTSVNPTLHLAEIGFNTTNNKFKIGDGATAWADLPYAAATPAELTAVSNAIPAPGTDYIAFSEKGASNGVAELNNDGVLSSSQINLTLQQIATNGSATTSFSNIDTIQFDEDSGFTVTGPSNNIAKVAMNSTFKYWEIDGVLKLTAVALDTVNFISGTGITISGNGGVSPQTLTIGVSPNTYDAYGAASTAISNLHVGGTSTGNVVSIDGTQTLTNKTISGASNTLSNIGNSSLTNSSISINGTSVSLGGSISGLATLASPTFTGSPAAPTASYTTNSTQIATTAFVKTAVDNLINGAGAAYDTLKELSDLIINDESTASALATTVGSKAPSANPTFTGTVTLPLTTLGYVTTNSSGVISSVATIPNAGLTNSSITLNGSLVSLGGSRTLGSDDIAEGSTNKYFTDERAQDAVGGILGTGLSYDDTTGIISVTASTYDAYGAAAAVIPSQSGKANKFLQTNGTSLSWTEVPITILGPISLTTNSVFLVDETPIDGFDLIEYTVYIKQGTLFRASKLFVLSDGTDVSADEYAISELGGLMNGVSVSASVDGGTRVILQVQILDAATSNAFIKLIKSVV
jgi:Major tropism determinant N-terminal domain